MAFWGERDYGHVLFRWQEHHALEEYMNRAADRFSSGANILCYITGGRGVWNIGDQSVTLAPGVLLGIQAGMLVELVNARTVGLEGWVVEFRQYGVLWSDAHGAELRMQSWAPPGGFGFLSAVVAGGAVRGQLQDLDLLSKGDTEQELGRHQLLYALLGALYKPTENGEPTAEQAVQRSMKYLQQHYYKPLTREELAKAAGLSPWHYSRKFRAMTGKPPLEYLNRYRMYRAQERLLQTGTRAQDIARQVGFEDAAYFSRRFKQLEGVSPREYVRTIADRSVLAMSPMYAETLVSLGVVPKAVAVVPLLLPDHQRALFERLRVRMIPTPQFSLDVQAISAEEPQMIVSHTIHEETKRSLMAVAPVAAGLSRDLLSAMAQLAALFRKEHEAEQVYAQIKSVDEQARARLAGIIRFRRTVMVLRVEPCGYRYMGAHSIGISRILYRELGLAIPPALNEGQHWFNPLRLEQLPLADPDFIFVENRVMEGGDTHGMMEALMSSKYWKRLNAVKNKRVQMIDTSLWVGYGPVGYALIVDQISEFLTKA